MRCWLLRNPIAIGIRDTPYRANCMCENVMLSTKPEIYNIFQQHNAVGCQSDRHTVKSSQPKIV